MTLQNLFPSTHFFYNCKKLVFVLSFIQFFFIHNLIGQHTQIDSLKSELGDAANDEQRLSILIKLGKALSESNPNEAKRVALRAVNLAKAKPHSSEISEASNVLGNIYFTLGMYDSSMRYHRQALIIATADNHPYQEEQACQGMAENFVRLVNGDSVRYYLQKSLTMAIARKDKISEARSYNTLGNMAIDENKFKEALENYIKAASIYEGLPTQTTGLGKALVNIANVENILGEYDKAHEYTKRSITLFQKNQDSLQLAYCYKLRGRIYRKQLDFEKALEQYAEAQKIYERASYRQQLGETHLGMGNIYFDMKGYSFALAEYNKALRVAKSIDDVNLMAYIYSAIGSGLNELKKFNLAISYLDTCFTYAKKINNRYLIMDGYQVLSTIYKEKGNDKKAFAMLLAYSNLKDSLTTEENRNALSEMEAKYQNTQKQSRIELLQKRQQLRLSQLRQSKIMLVTLMVSIILLIIIVYMGFVRYRLINKLSRQTAVEKIRQQIGKDLHDDIGSTLSSIHIISQFAIDENKPDNAVKHFKVIGEQSARMLETMSDMVWSINPSNDSM
ncbi:MAG TPA: tetratricopeptide repeat protein, partial [Cyclobacteriaceae bacterium]|nr:tetratricopeptide repeat protein [Cyclobacteriaceae bacterium]